jgi:hypothetical protein
LDEVVQAAACSPVLEAATFPTQWINLSNIDAPDARKVRFRIADAARRAIRRFSSERGLKILEKLPLEHQPIFFECWAQVASSLGEFKSLGSFYRNHRGNSNFNDEKRKGAVSDEYAKGLVSERASYILAREHLISNINSYNDDRVYFSRNWLDLNRIIARVPLADACVTQSQRGSGGSDLPHLPPPYISGDPLVHVLDDLSAIERFPGSLGFLVEEAAYRLAKVASEARPEIAAVLRNLPWEMANVHARSMAFGQDARDRSEAVKGDTGDAPLLWCLRARIRSLSKLSEQQRRDEEFSILASIEALPDCVLSAQCVELLAERSAFLDKDALISAALEFGGLSHLDRACLSVRMFHLIAEEPKRIRLAADIISSIDNIGDTDERIMFIRTLYGDRLLTNYIGNSLEYLIQNIDDPIKKHYAAHRSSAVLSSLADGILSDLDCLGGEAFAPLIVYAALDEALAKSESMQAEPKSGQLKSLDENDIATMLVRESITCRPGVLLRCEAMLEPFRGTEFADQLSAIVRASLEGLGPQTIREVVSALVSDYDDVRARARALILPEDWEHYLSGSGCGLETLLLLARERAGSLQPGIGVQLAWRLERTVIDSVELLRELVSLAAGTGERSEMALGVLDGVNKLSIGMSEQLAAAVPVATPGLRSVIWLQFARATRRVKPSDRRVISSESLPAELFGPDQVANPDPCFILATPTELVGAVVGAPDPEGALVTLRREYGHVLSELFREFSDEAALLIGSVGATRFTRNAAAEEREASVREAAQKLLSHDHGPARVAEFLDHLLRSSVIDPQPGSFVRSDIATILAAAADISPARITREFERADVNARLAAMATANNSYPGRRAAFLLMGHIIDAPRKYLSPAQTAALLSVEIDVPQVIDAALIAAARVRATSPNSLARFKAALHGPNASKSALSGRMLISIARNRDMVAENRAEILRFVGDFVSHPLANRAVYFGRLDALTPVAQTIRDQLLEELSAVGGGVTGR